MKITPSGSSDDTQQQFRHPYAGGSGWLGNIYVTDLGAGQVDEISADGGFSVLVSNFPSPSGIAADKQGDVFLTRANSNQVYEAGGGNLRSIGGQRQWSYQPGGGWKWQPLHRGRGQQSRGRGSGERGQQFTVLSGVASTAIAVDGAGDLFVLNGYQPTC